MIALAFALTWSACSNAGSGNDAATISSANAFWATPANATCTQIQLSHNPFDDTWALKSPGGGPATYADRGNESPAWASAFEKAGLFQRKSTDPEHYKIIATPRLMQLLSNDTNLCFGHPVADSVIKTEAINDYAVFGFPKDARMVQFQAHFAFANWAGDPTMQSALWISKYGSAIKDMNPQSFRIGLYGDPSDGWREHLYGGQ